MNKPHPRSPGDSIDRRTVIFVRDMTSMRRFYEHILSLDDRFAPRFAENAARFHGERRRFTFHAGMGHVPTDVAPDVRSCSYAIEAFVEIEEGAEGVLVRIHRKIAARDRRHA